MKGQPVEFAYLAHYTKVLSNPQEIGEPFDSARRLLEEFRILLQKRITAEARPQIIEVKNQLETLLWKIERLRHERAIPLFEYHWASTDPEFETFQAIVESLGNSAVATSILMEIRNG